MALLKGANPKHNVPWRRLSRDSFQGECLVSLPLLAKRPSNVVILGLKVTRSGQGISLIFFYVGEPA